MTEPPPTTCPQCGAPLDPNRAGGLCPKCLLQAGFESDAAVDPDTEPAPNAGSPGPRVDHDTPTVVGRGFVPPEPAELDPLFPQLEVLELLGKGGMGAVYKARQPALDRFVALKILPPEVGSDPAFAERFTREARALAKLAHPNIVTVHDVGRAGDLYFIVMEYVDGANLREVIRRSDLKPEEALAIVPQICEALQYAHDEGVVHRDVKPENLLLDGRGRVKIADFGLAKLLGDAGELVSLTGTAQVMGTLRYMAPEQMHGSKTVDHRADIYALGVVFYELLTGEVPMGRFPPPSQRVQVDVRLDEVVLRALESEPEKRYQRAGDMKTDTEQVSSNAAERRASPPVREPATGPPEEHPTLAALRWWSSPQPDYGRVVGLPLMLFVTVYVIVQVAVLVAVPLDEQDVHLFVSYGGLALLGGAWLYLNLRYIAKKSAANVVEAGDQTPRNDESSADGGNWDTAPLSEEARLAVIAICLVVGGMVTTAGVVLGAVATRYEHPGAFWGTLGGALGCIIGGLGTVVGTWNSYRKLRGAPDLLTMPERTSLDRGMTVYSGIGILLLTAAGGLFFASQPTNVLLDGKIVDTTPAWADKAWTASYFLVLAGGLIAFQGGTYLVFRWLLRRDDTAPSNPTPGGLSRRAVVGAVLTLPFLLLAGSLAVEQLTGESFGGLLPGVVWMIVPAILACLLGGLALHDLREGRRSWGWAVAVYDVVVLPLAVVNAAVLFVALAIGASSANETVQRGWGPEPYGPGATQAEIREYEDRVRRFDRDHAMRFERSQKYVATMLGVPACVLVDLLLVVAAWRTLGPRKEGEPLTLDLEESIVHAWPDRSAAIMVHRRATGASLAEARQAIERVATEHGLPGAKPPQRDVLLRAAAVSVVAAVLVAVVAAVPDVPGYLKVPVILGILVPALWFVVSTLWAANSELDQNDDSSIPEATPAELDAAARRVRTPLAMLFVVGFAQVIVAGLTTAWLGIVVYRINASPQTEMPRTTTQVEAITGGNLTTTETVTVKSHPWSAMRDDLTELLIVCAVSLVVGLLVMAAAVRGSQLRDSGLVTAGVLLAFLPSPVWPFGVVAGCLAFGAIRRQSVRRAFAAIAERDESVADARPTILEDWTSWTIGGVVVAILAAADALVPWVWQVIFVIRVLPLGIDVWQGIVVCVVAGSAAVLLAAWATIGRSRTGQGVTAVVAGVAIAIVAGEFLWEIQQPPEVTTSVSGDDELAAIGEEFAKSFTNAIRFGPSVGTYVALVLGALLAIVGCGQLIVPRPVTSKRDAIPSQSD